MPLLQSSQSYLLRFTFGLKHQARIIFKDKIQQWLIWAVAQAEKELGSGTGQLKIKYVYDLFISKFPAVAIFIKYETFANMVEKALDEFKEMIDTNRRISEEFGAADSYGTNDFSGLDTDEEAVGGPNDEQ